MTDPCSALALKQMADSKEIGKAQRLYLLIFMETGEAYTHRQVTEQVWLMHQRRMPARNGRIAELESMGFIKKHDTQVDPVTRKLVNRWVWTGRMTAKASQRVWAKCHFCGGHGRVYRRVFTDQGRQQELFDTPALS